MREIFASLQWFRELFKDFENTKFYLTNDLHSQKMTLLTLDKNKRTNHYFMSFLPDLPN